MALSVPCPMSCHASRHSQSLAFLAFSIGAICATSVPTPCARLCTVPVASVRRSDGRTGVEGMQIPQIGDGDIWQLCPVAVTMTVASESSATACAPPSSLSRQSSASSRRSRCRCRLSRAVIAGNAATACSDCRNAVCSSVVSVASCRCTSATSSSSSASGMDNSSHGVHELAVSRSHVARFSRPLPFSLFVAFTVSAFGLCQPFVEVSQPLLGLVRQC